MRYWLKGCLRCGGDLQEEWDVYGHYISCLQCGYILSQAQEMGLLTIAAIVEPIAIKQAA